MRMLKCPSCRSQRAWLKYGIGKAKDGWKNYKQKHCSCGHIGARHYFGRAFPTEQERIVANTELREDI